jgi:hypothetical protein
LHLHTRLAAMKLQKGTPLSWMISLTVATPVLALIVVSLYDINFADSYEHICCTSSSSFSSLSTMPTTSLSSKASQVNSSYLLSSAIATEVCNLMRANVCQTTRRLVTCPFIDNILHNIMTTPMDL